MTPSTIGSRLGLSLLAAGCTTARIKPGDQAAANGKDADVIPVSEHKFPPMDGSRLEAKLVVVRYGPGGSSEPHRHPCAVIGYVLEGAYRSALEADSARVYRVGESFYEPPNGLHRVSANASTTESVRFLATFTCDRSESPAPAAGDSGKH